MHLEDYCNISWVEDSPFNIFPIINIVKIPTWCMSIMSFPHFPLNMQFLQFLFSFVLLHFLFIIIFHLKTSFHNFFHNYAIEIYFIFILIYHYFFIFTWNFSQKKINKVEKLKIYFFFQFFFKVQIIYVIWKLNPNNYEHLQW